MKIIIIQLILKLLMEPFFSEMNPVPSKQIILVETSLIICKVHISFYFYVISIILWAPNSTLHLKYLLQTLPEPPLFTNLIGNTQHMNKYIY